MGAAKRAAAFEAPAVQRAGDGMDHRYFEGFGRIEFGENARQPFGEHGFPRPRRAGHQQIVAAGGRHFEGPLGAFLALDVGQIGDRRRVVGHFRRGRAQDLGALEMVDQGQQAAGRQYLDLPRPGGLGPLRRRTDQPEPAARGAQRRRQDPGHRRDGAVQGELAQGREAGDLVLGQYPHGGQQPEGDGQVEMTALLEEVGGRQVDGDPLGRQGEADGRDGGANPLPAFRHRLVGQADHRKGRHAGADLHLHVHVQHVDSGKCDRIDPGDHGFSDLPVLPADDYNEGKRTLPEHMC